MYTDVNYNQEPLDTDNLLDQFRGNLIIDGAEAFSEDHWKQIVFKDKDSSVILDRHDKCIRCYMIGIDQRNGDDIKGLVQTLIYMTERGFSFGTLFKHSDYDFQSFRIKVGQDVDVI